MTPSSSATHPHLALPLLGIGDSLVALDRPAEALSYLERGTALQDDASSDRAYGLTSLARCLVALRRFAPAVTPLERAVTLREAKGDDPLELARSRLLLARALWGGTGDRDRAVAEARQAQRAFAAAGEEHAADRAEADAWLAAHARR